MAATKRYQVIGACALVKVHADGGDVVLTYPQFAYLPEGVDEDTIEHLVDVGIVAERELVEFDGNEYPTAAAAKKASAAKA